ncbi:acyl-CoA dehydrogenase family protein [Pseudonocardia alni]|uniref:acyl-CoA dehydrogenase family protein n=1 Tax=Pseudonocardia alni TaxID=33907 RepID=UPI0033D68087
MATSTRSGTPLTRARAAAPVVRAAGPRIEEAGTLPADVVSALADAELFWLTAPAGLGGAEGSATDVLAVVEEITAADVSAGWSLMVNIAATGGVLARCADDALPLLFADGPPVLAGSVARADGGQVVRVDGGYAVGGRFRFASGSAHATWMSSRMILDDAPVSVLLPVDRLEFVGGWDVLGLRGTGSRDYRVPDQVVPDPLVFRADAVPRRGPGVHRLGAYLAATVGHGGIALGIGRRAFEELAAAVAADATRPGRTPMLDDPHFRHELAAQEARLRAARAYCFDAVHDASAAVDDGRPVSDLLGHRIRQAITHATGVAAESAAFAFRWAGSAALRTPHPLAGLLRDAHTAAQHVAVAPASLTEVGAAVLADYARP